MKRYIIQVLGKIANSLTKLHKKLVEVENKPESLFEDLTPSTDIDENGKYAEAITWALKNDNVKNIALTGPYGSGKSSLLKTYEKKHGGTYHFLNISLATFQSEEKQNEENNLEKSILQQMIYRVKDRTIPFSRFKRIKHVKNRSIILYLTLFLASVTASIYLFQPTYLKKVYDETLFQQSFNSGHPLKILWTFILIAVTLLFPFVFLKNIYSLIRGNLNFNKLTIANATIEKNNEDAQSIFDKYLDEILYFFEATNYNVVIFEDLDRFGNLDIFERLRELNSLINNSKQINRRVVFIYAIKDEIFGQVDDLDNNDPIQDRVDFSKNRTKFFDFIIPVIPIINSSNSLDKLMDKIDKLSYADKVKKDFLNDVTVYIDDMRILKNIFNEFIIYKDKLGEIDLDLNRLLAMVIYKNIYPFDFSQLQYRKGLVYEVLEYKTKIIHAQTHILESKIVEIEEEIKRSEQETLVSLKELQLIYLDELGMYKRGNYENYSITIGTTTYYGKNSINPQDFFDKLKQVETVNYYLLNYGHGQAEVEKIVTVFDSKPNYFKREESIKLRDEDGINLLKEELAELKRKKAEASAKSLKELIEESDPQDVFSEVIYNQKLLIYLLRHGYIDEMYNHYLTYFHPGSMSEADMKFIFSIKNLEPLEANHSLHNIDKVIERLNGNEFKQIEILNYDLLNHLMNNSQLATYYNYYEAIITQLASETKKAIDFITGFRRVSTNKKRFIQSICQKWDNIWDYVQNDSNFTIEEKDSYASDILAFADLSDIKKINKGEELSNFIAQHRDFLSIAPTNKSICKQILSDLNVKFLALEKIMSNQELFDYVVEKELYEINSCTLAIILGIPADQLSYSAIKQAGRQVVLDYIDTHIEIYIKQVLLKVAINEETEEGLVELLNRDEVSMNLKEALIAAQPIVIADITNVNEEIWPVLFGFKKISVTWSNVVAYFKEGEILEKELVSFLNDLETARELSAHSIGDANADPEVVRKLSENIIKNQHLTEASFEILASSIDRFSFFPVDTLPIKRVETMISREVLTLSTENFESIKASHSELFCLYLEENIDQFIRNMDNYQLEHESVVQLFHSARITKNHKVRLIEALDTTNLSKEDTIFAEDLAGFIIENQVEFSASLVGWLVAADVSLNAKLMLISKYIDELKISDIGELLNKIGGVYAEIAENGRRPQIRNNKVNLDFVEALHKKRYISSSNVKGRNIRINTKLKMEIE